MSAFEIIDLTPENIADYGVCGYYCRSEKGIQRKNLWDGVDTGLHR